MANGKLYFCDGYACEEYQKKACYQYGGPCHHTLHAEHALSLLYDDFPATKFVAIPSSSIRKEHFDENGIFKQMGRELVPRCVKS